MSRVARSVRDQRLEVVPASCFAAAEEVELDHEGDADDLAAELLDEVAIASTVPPVASTSSWTSTRGAVGDRVGVQLERVLRRTRARRSR